MRRVFVTLDLPTGAPIPTDASHLAAILGAWPKATVVSVIVAQPPEGES